MINRALVFGAFVALFCLAGCATVPSYSGITYHHFSPSEGSYWMTVAGNKTETTQVASIWRCDNSSGGPRCTQAKLIQCSDPKECQITADEIYQQTLGQ